MNLKKALLAATVLAMPVVAQAQPVSGLYIGAGAGGNFHAESKWTTLGVRAKITTDPGAVGLASIGYGFGNGLRAEIEGNYRQNSVDKTQLNGFGKTSTRGYINNYGAMANLLYDFQTGTPFTPYVGAGVGYGWMQFQTFRASSATRSLTSDADAANFAYQGILGVAYNLGAYVPGLALTLEGRYYGTVEPRMKGEVRNGPYANSPIALAGKFQPSNENASVLLGVRYAFGVAPIAAAVAPPVAPPAIARTYLVFFDWDKYNLTDRAKQIIAEAAEASRKVGTTKIDVAGHADRSGTVAHNQALSQRRADAVAAELVAKGVAKSEIMISAFGESRPLVPTADGVREPQNRRVEIVLK